jgi:hypothetical protein
MTTKATSKHLETKLKGKSYPEIERALAMASHEVLIGLLDSRSIKIGDSAADLLTRKRQHPLLISTTLANRLATKLGKIRATNILFGSGRKYPEALKAYFALLKDRNDEVADNALLGLVYWGNREAIPAIKERQKTVKTAEAARRFDVACEALEKNDPKIFSPHFVDDAGIWKQASS